ncbi:hypothetical protein [Sediminibacterium ginsengisoli]|uniref:hypothetical protein n=1 Tax=Sediminibacterium ginsengisoli TaxID=413434 RepID=UPI00099D4D0E|nr:hypothetical protein [Sediminibacterium ginsengisoli]
MKQHQPEKNKTVQTPDTGKANAGGKGLSLPAVPAKQLKAANAVIQMEKADIYGSAAFANPAATLATKYPQALIKEEPGSQGIDGDPDVEMIKVLAGEKTRDKFFTFIFERLQQAEADYKKYSEAFTDNSEDEGIQTLMNEANGRVQKIKAIQENSDLYKINDVTSAANWYKANTLALSKAGLSPKLIRIKPASSGAASASAAKTDAHDFHRDAGYLKVTAGGGVSADLNGPSSKGWVRGHSGIDNYAHRFVEHIHVDKDDHENRFEIYNADKSVVDAARAFGNSKKASLHPKSGAGFDAMAAEEGTAGAASLASAIAKATPKPKPTATATTTTTTAVDDSSSSTGGGTTTTDADASESDTDTTG